VCADVRPRIAITSGDPAGIGPEVVLKALADDGGERDYIPIVIGDLADLRSIATTCGLDLDIAPIESTDDAAGDRVSVLDIGAVAADVSPGEISPAGGSAAWTCITHGVELCLAGGADSLVTAPLNKQALELAGHGHDGHTEILQRLTGSAWSLTLFVLPDLRVLFYSRHLSLRDAIAAVKADRIYETIERFVSVAPSIGMPNPRIAVAGLNPHCGENGLFGTEELDEIEPGLDAARAAGFDVLGPIPADSVFHQAREGRFDVVLSLYHDQAASVTKSIDFHGTVSITLGLPFLRFSVDHGTGFDIAAKYVADHRNMANTLALASSWSRRYAAT
jgi:4-phospho-D-threonate 3-dehydrogenase / 4-phospho-D-erythronate 3-dehydrogenase